MMTTDRATQASDYARRRRILWLMELVWTAGWCLAIYAVGWSRAWVDWATMVSSTRWGSIALYSAVLGGGLYVVEWPLHYYGGFVLEHRFGLSNQTWWQWMGRDVKQQLVGAPLGLLFVEGLYLCIDHAPVRWWLWLALAWWVVSIMLARIVPTVIIPLFYKCTPLDDAGLRQALVDLSTRVRVPIMNAFRIDLSRDTKKANAAVVGWGKTRRVLIADTLLASFTPEEITSVVAHELGHHRLHHIPVHLASSLVTTAAGFWALQQVALRWLPVPLGDVAALPLLMVLITLLSTALLPVHNGLSRIMERQADRFALDVTQAPQPFIAAMRKLADQNLAEVHPARWIEWFFYSHPAIARRIQMGEDAARRQAVAQTG